MKTLQKISITIGTVGLVALFLLPQQAKAETPAGPEVFGIGVQLGDPSGLTMKWLPSEIVGVHFHLGAGGWHEYGWYDNGYYIDNMFITGADVIIHPINFVENWDVAVIGLTLGAGAALGLFKAHYYNWYYRDNPAWDYRDDDVHGALFIRFVTRASMWFRKFPLEVFVELNPALQFFEPSFGFRMFWVGAGARWWF